MGMSLSVRPYVQKSIISLEVQQLPLLLSHRFLPLPLPLFAPPSLPLYLMTPQFCLSHFLSSSLTNPLNCSTFTTLLTFKILVVERLFMIDAMPIVASSKSPPPHCHGLTYSPPPTLSISAAPCHIWPRVHSAARRGRVIISPAPTSSP